MKRFPSTLGMVGFDGGYKRAVTMALSPKPYAPSLDVDDTPPTPPPTCCMYPAYELDALFTAADLPATLRVTYRNLTTNEIIGPITVTKSGSGYNDGQSIGDGGITIGKEQDTWVTRKSSLGFEGVSPCLTYEGLLSDEFYPLIVEDDFAATYTVSGTTLTRMSLCRWAGGSWNLVFNYTTCKWNLNGNVKTSGYQNTPTGTYGTGTVA